MITIVLNIIALAVIIGLFIACTYLLLMLRKDRLTALPLNKIQPIEPAKQDPIKEVQKEVDILDGTSALDEDEVDTDFINYLAEKFDDKKYQPFIHINKQNRGFWSC